MRIKSLFFISVGLVSTGVGVVGIVLPVLPTTPFFILASFFFAKGSDRFDAWFKNTKIYKDYAENFIRDRSMTLKRKVSILLFADLMIVFPFVKLDNTYIRLSLLAIVAIKYYYFIFKIKTKGV